MKAAGLAPGGVKVGGHRTWTQPVTLTRSDIIGAPGVKLTIAGAQRDLTQGSEIAVRAPLNGATSIAVTDRPLVFVGYGVSAPELGWDDYKGVDLHGKIMVVLVNDPDYETGEGDFGGKAITYYGRWDYKYEEGARRGAAGVLIVHETGPASYGWATVKNSNTNSTFDMLRAAPATAHVPIEGWIQFDLAKELCAASGFDIEVLRREAESRDFHPHLLNASLSANYRADVRTIHSQNVLGLLPGRTHPNETVIYSAHWDHLGIGAADVHGDRIYNGARDNATGIASLLELGRNFARSGRRERSLLFLATTAEEKGLLGARFYVANPIYALGRTVGVINMDTMSVDGPARNFIIPGLMKNGLIDDIADVGKQLGRQYDSDARPEAGGFYRMDHFAFAKAGVPAISFVPGRDLIDGGKARGDALDASYVRDRYHQPADEWRPDWNLTGLTLDLRLLYTLGERLSDGREWPTWGATTEFRATRDRTRGMR